MEAWFVISLLLIGVVLFCLEKISVDIVTLFLLLALILGGVLTPKEAFAGFSEDIIIMLAAIFVIGTALRDTGMLDLLGQVLIRSMGGQVKKLTAVMMAGVSTVSAFMNNTTVTAMFVGPVIGLARQAKISPSRLLMPLAFASIMGGTCTLIGTSTNVAVSGYMAKVGLGPVGMFELTPIGLVLVVVGTLYMLVIGLRQLPDNADAEDGTLSLREYLAEVVILEDSPLIGQEVHSSDFSVLGFQVLKISRQGHVVEATPHERLQAGDVVLVAGKVEDLIKIKKIEGLDILEDVNLRGSEVDVPEAQIAEVVITPRAALVGNTLRSYRFRQRSGLSVLAIHRGAQSLLKELGEVVIQPGDVLLIQGSYERIRAYEENMEMVVITQHHQSPGNRQKGLLALAAFALAVALSSFNIIPASVAMLMVALFAVVIRCIHLDTAYENIDWRMLILIGGMTAFGQAMTKSGAAEMLASAVTSTLGNLGPMAVLAGFTILTVLLTQPMSNAAAALVVLPVALHAAE